MTQSVSLQPRERLIAFILTAVIVVALVVLTLWGAPIDPSLALPLRFLLALAAAVLGATVPGAALKLSFAGRGLAVRAAGAMALFLVVWLAGPQMTGASPASANTAKPIGAELSHADR